MTPLPRLILASASPRRRQLLRLAGLSFTVRPSQVIEHRVRGESARRRAMRLARAKAEDVAGRLRRPAWVLGCDTLVVCKGRLLEKPTSQAQARRMTELLSGGWHEVISAVALLPAQQPGARLRSGTRLTRVRFAHLSPLQRDWLLAAGEHMDKAGAYAAQGRAGYFITDLRGPYSNVVGLPMDLVGRCLQAVGYIPGGIQGG